MFAFFRRQSKIRSAHTRSSFVGGMVQQLENRRLLAATVTASATQLTVTGSAGDDSLTLTISGGNYWLDSGTGAVDTGFASAGRPNVALHGLAGNDILDISALPVGTVGYLSGGADADDLDGSAGNDTLLGGAGADSFDAGSGNDTLFVDGSDLAFLAGAGQDRLRPEAGSLGLNVVLTDLSEIEDIEGTGLADTIDASAVTVTNAITMQGFGGDDTLKGGAGNDVLIGGAGNDTLNGGGGNDRLFTDSNDTGWIGGAGSDRLTADAGSAALNITLLATAGIEEIYGTPNPDTINAGAQVGSNVAIFGYGGADVLTGGAGNDSLAGGDGDDSLTGGEGNDILLGEAGIDSFSGGNGANSFQIDGSDQVFVGGTGYDRIIAVTGSSAINITIAAGASIDYIRGSNFADNINASAEVNPMLISGLNGDDILIGGSGNDTILGGAGDDTLDGRLGADQVNGESGAHDVITYATSLVGVEVNMITNVNRYGTANNDVLTNIEDIVGSGFNDSLRGSSVANIIKGNAGVDSLFGEGGDDVLEGGIGIDSLQGGAGADSFNAGDGNDTLTVDGADLSFLGGAGADRILADAATLTGLNLILTDANEIEEINGSSLDDVIDASAVTLTANLFISGLGGNDTLKGGAGNDQLIGGAGIDSFNGGSGADRLFVDGSDASFVGGLGADRLQPEAGSLGLTIVLADQAGIEEITGTNFDDTINASAETLTAAITILGMAGNDTLSGGAGNDNILGGLGADSINGGGGNDKLYANSVGNNTDGSVDSLIGGLGTDQLFGDTVGDLDSLIQ